MNRILLVGGGGYIGNTVAYNFLKKKHNVSILDNFIYNHKETLNNLLKFKNLNIIDKDIRNKIAIETYLKNFDIVIVLAGLVGDPITKKYPKLSNEINDIALKNIIDISFKNKIKKLIFISTCSNYGLVENDKLAKEEHKLKPLSLYAKSKVNLENYIMSFKNKNTRTITTVLRFATAFGLSNRMRFDLTVNHFVKDAEKEKKLIIYDSETWRPYCHVQDFSNIIENVMFAKDQKVNFQIFNSGSNKNNFTKKMISDEIINLINNVDLKFVTGDQDKRNYKVDFTKIKKTLNFEASYSIKDGIVEVRDFLKKKNLGLDLSNYGNYQIEI
mgnify:FL=1